MAEIVEVKALQHAILERALNRYDVVRVVVYHPFAGVELPAEPNAVGLVPLDVGYNMPKPISDLSLDADALRGGFSFEGVEQQCVIPWGSVAGIFVPDVFQVAFVVDSAPSKTPTLSVVK